jgi:hypothetical protein
MPAKDFTRENSLDIRKVTLAWKNTDNVYLQSGVGAGEAVVISTLSTLVQGMPPEDGRRLPNARGCSGRKVRWPMQTE